MADSDKRGEEKPAVMRKATALSYEPGADQAPKIVATGRGEIAERIVETARQADVPVYEDAHLADVLGTLKLGSEIPRELYEVVAEVLAFVSRLDEQALARRRAGARVEQAAQASGRAGQAATAGGRVGQASPVDRRAGRAPRPGGRR